MYTASATHCGCRVGRAFTAVFLGFFLYDISKTDAATITNFTYKNSSGDEIANVLVNDDIAQT